MRLWKNLFESSVNPEGIQTVASTYDDEQLFESSVNPEGIQTFDGGDNAQKMFESSVNPEGIQTDTKSTVSISCLRVV